MAIVLRYDKSFWEEKVSKPINTLQPFITNRCNMNCSACFFRHRLGQGDMSFEAYKEYVLRYAKKVKKVNIMGGEPTLHPDLLSMIYFNRSLGLKTTIYTNGAKMEHLRGIEMLGAELRLDPKENWISLPTYDFSLPIMIVFMMWNKNKDRLLGSAKLAEMCGCKKFFIASIRDIHKTGDYWKDTGDTVPLDEYAIAIQDFMDNYKGNMEIHIARRGILTTEKIMASKETSRCRFGNIFVSGDMITCPFDIAKEIKVTGLSFGKKICDKCEGCILQKIVLKRK